MNIVKPAIIAALLAFALTACGGRPETTTDALDNLPACTDAWVVGQTLPEDYEGCQAEDGTLMAAVGYECTGGRGTLYAMESGSRGELYAVTGQRVGDTADAGAYGKVYDACLG